MICKKIPLKIIDIEFHLIEIEHWLCKYNSLNCSFKMSEVNSFPPKTRLFAPYALSSFLPSRAHLFTPPRRLTFPPCSDIFVLNDEAFSFGEGICSRQLVA